MARDSGRKSMNNGDGQPASGRRLSVRQVGWALVAIVAALFVLLNNDKAEINFIVASPEWPMWVLAVASMVLGFLLAKLTAWRRRED